MKILKFILVTFFLMALTIAGLAAFFGYQEYHQFMQEEVVLTEDNAVFEIKKGSNMTQIAKQLESRGIISNALYFRLLGKYQDKSHKVKAGEYQLLPNMDMTELLDLFVSGKTLQHQLSIIEGKSFKQVIETVRNHPTLIKTLTDDDYANIMPLLGMDEAHPEGWFFPDTYNFPSKTTDLEFLQRAHKNMKEFLQVEWDKSEPSQHIKTPYEALILASIVEKETGIPEERPLIAGVFLNRLEKGMLLQTDPTVIYGMGDRYKGNIRKSDLRRDTPYNTYTRKGLTPTPIAVPSAEAIKAVFNPQETDALYFVADGSGGHYFSKTYAEHKKAVVKYLLNGNASRYKGDK